MPELTDHELLSDFARSESEDAFAALVARYLNLVYSTALRSTGNSHHAEEITQAVFIILARKATGLSSRVVLSGWLYQTARLTAANFVKGEIRRQRREQEVYMQSTLNEPDTIAWEQIAPLLDDAMGRLGEKDRNAIVLRFFENKTAAQAAAALRLSEAATHKRTTRALDKLRDFFSKHGVNSTTAIISGAISIHSVHTAPAVLAKSITAAALAKGATASASTLTLIKGALKVMAWTKAKTAVVIGMAGILAIGTTTMGVKKHSAAVTENYFTLDQAVLKKAPPLLILRPSRYAHDPEGDCIISEYPDIYFPGKIMRRDCTFGEVLTTAYGIDESRVIFPPDAPKGRFDLLLTITNRPTELLSAELKKQFGYIAHQESRDADVLVLRVVDPTAAGLQIDTERTLFWDKRDTGRFAVKNFKMSDITFFLSTRYFGKPVVDETGLTNSYDFDLHWNGTINWNAQLAEVKRAMREQLGLELTPAKRSIEMLVVEKGR